MNEMGQATHEELRAIVKNLDTDFEPYGKRERDGSDCSCGCKFFHALEGKAGSDWGVCTNPKSPRCGILTFEHQGCQEFEADQRWEKFYVEQETV
jgi:hypothetical protein